MFDWPAGCTGRAQEDRATAISGAFLLSKADLVRELGVHRSAVTRDMTLVAEEYGVSMMLLYYCQAWSHVIQGRPLFDEQVGMSWRQLAGQGRLRI